MEGFIQNEYYATSGSESGSNYDLYLTDYTTSNYCTPTTDGGPGNPLNMGSSFTAYYALYISELTSASSRVLARTTSMEFTDCQFALTTSETGVWNYYNSGDGFGTSIYNSGYNDSYPDTMHNSGSNIGYFDITWLTSNGTG